MFVMGGGGEDRETETDRQSDRHTCTMYGQTHIEEEREDREMKQEEE